MTSDPTLSWTIEVAAYDLTAQQVTALYDRVIDAAHALDEQVTCLGPAPIKAPRVWLYSKGRCTARRPMLGGDEHDRRTLLVPLPGERALVVALWPDRRSP